MIDISQWRTSIGLWGCCHISCCTHSKKIANTETSIWIDGATIVRKIKDLTFSLGVFLSLLLILSGDIELNPGPKTGNLLKTLPIVLYIIYTPRLFCCLFLPHNRLFLFLLVIIQTSLD